MLRLWEANNVKKAVELIGIDMVLIDWKVHWLLISLLSVSNFFNSMLSYFTGSTHLKRGLYELSVFGATRSNPNFRFGDTPFPIRFTDQTMFVDLAESIPPHPNGELLVLQL